MSGGLRARGPLSRAFAAFPRRNLENTVLIAVPPRYAPCSFAGHTVEAMALTAKEMNSKYRETSEGGLAVSVVLCQASHHPLASGEQACAGA
jgi:hypothetical protein